MLASILPGLRDIRAPLAAGYMWLLAGYVAFEPLAPARPHGVWKSLQHLDHRLSALGLGIAVSFAAYLAGTLSQILYPRLLDISYALSVPLEDALFATLAAFVKPFHSMRERLRERRLSQEPLKNAARRLRTDRRRLPPQRCTAMPRSRCTAMWALRR